MTYSILSLDTGNILESYGSEDRAFEAACRIRASEPEATSALAVVIFDEDGMAVGNYDGPALAERLDAFVADHHGAHA